MWKDPIVEEVRRARERHAAKFNYDLRSICDALRRDEERGRRKVVSLAPKKPHRWAKAS